MSIVIRYEDGVSKIVLGRGASETVKCIRYSASYPANPGSNPAVSFFMLQRALRLSVSAGRQLAGRQFYSCLSVCLSHCFSR